MESLIVGVSGVRGVVGEGLTPEVVVRFGAAFGTYLAGGRVVVGRDSRRSGQMMRDALVAGLVSTGCDVTDVGVVPTPTIQLAVEELETSGGVAITASHNPVEWNALKFIGAGGAFLSAGEGARLLDLYRAGTTQRVGWGDIGSITADRSAVDRHIERVLGLSVIDVDRIRERQYGVAIDCCNGGASIAFPQLLRSLGCAVVELNCEPSGLFPRDPEPVPRNLSELSQAVRKVQADVGFATDADGDRLSIVSNSGKPLGEEASLALAVSYVLAIRPGPVVANVSTSRAIDDIAARFGQPVIRSKVGEAHVVRAMRDSKAVIGGEGNGGVIFPELHYARDGMVGMAFVLASLAGQGVSVDELAGGLPRYHIVKESARATSATQDELTDIARSAFPDGSYDLTDGVKVMWENRWVHIRVSGTEPIVRIIAEAPEEEEASRMCSVVKERL